MQLSTKLLLFLLAVVIVAAGALLIYKEHQISQQQQLIQQQQMASQNLIDNINRAAVTYATKEDLNAFAQQNGVNLKAIMDNLNQLHASLEAINKVVASSTGQDANNLPSTTTVPGANPNPPPANNQSDPYNYQRNKQVLQLNEDFVNGPQTTQVPIGSVGFSAWQQNPWSIDLVPRTYNLTNTIGQDENGKTYTYNKFTINVNGKDYSIPVNSQVVNEVPTASMHWFSPKAMLTTGVGVNLSDVPVSPAANIGATVQLADYGQFRTTPDWSFMALGAGYQVGSKTVAGIVNPVSYNIGKLVPGHLANNTYLGPSYQLDAHGNHSITAQLSLGF